MKITYLFVLFFLLTTSLFAQTKVVSSHKELTQEIAGAVYELEDSVKNSVFLKGELFFKFQTDSNGTFTNIQTSSVLPIVLVKIIKDKLQTLSFPKNASNILNNTFILPIFHYFEKPFPQDNPEAIDEMLVKMGVDLSTFVPNFNQNGFFETGEKTLWGIEGVLLPWIILKPSVTLH